MKFYQVPYFPPNFKYLGYMGLIGGTVLLLIGNIIAGPPVLLVAIVLSFTRVGCKVDTTHKTITEFTSLLGIIVGKPEKYQALKKLMVKANEISQVLNSRGSSTTLHYTIYNAYLFYDNQSVLLKGGKNKEKIVSKMASVAKALAIPFEVV